MTFVSSVKTFHKVFDHAHPSSPTLSPFNDPAKDMALRDLRVRLIDEEFEELKDALAAEDIVEVADALGDLIYVVVGAAIAWGIPIEKVFDEIHRSNMSKLDENGNPLFREDGKVAKSHLYSPPNLVNILMAARNAS